MQRILENFLVYSDTIRSTSSLLIVFFSLNLKDSVFADFQLKGPAFVTNSPFSSLLTVIRQCSSSSTCLDDMRCQKLCGPSKKSDRAVLECELASLETVDAY